MFKNQATAGKSSYTRLTKAGYVTLIASAVVLGTFSATEAAVPAPEFVNGKVTSFTAQLPMYTVAIVNNKSVRFCDPKTGSDYAVNAGNLHYDMLKAAFLNNKSVQVGVHNFGNDPQAGSIKLCIDRVILSQ